MLYLDSSALVKHYIQEAGTPRIENLLRVEEDASRPVFTSVLTFAEIHAAVARRMKDKCLSYREFVRSRKRFDSDWAFGISPVELGVNVLGFVRGIVMQFPLKGADTIHLASALWLRDTARLSAKLGVRGEKVIMVTSDKQLASAAKQSHLDVFDPETP